MSSTEILKISIIGAGGKTGFRALENLSKESYALYFCVKSPVGIKKIETKGSSISPAEEAVPQSDVMILSVPDKLIKTVSTELVPLMKSDATCILLDPAAAYLGEVELGQDCSFVVSHPCHPVCRAGQPGSSQRSLRRYSGQKGHRGRPVPGKREELRRC
jgi:prephenate dehydrogenase